MLVTMSWGNPGPERPFLPVEECWEWRKEEHSRVSFVSHLTSAPQNTNRIRDEVKGKCHISRGFISSNCDARRHLETLYVLLQFARMENKKIPLVLWRKQSTRGCAHTVKGQCVSRLSVWTGQILSDKDKQKKQQMTSMTLRISSNCL